ncbi:molybdopterin molybdotransferase MoeA [Demequina maris]|uniref:molybdopterin molybdotransferase MoeA n=1 Tax=Demequina maris TaxID=1638982 RepID=UPI000783B004|nr:gephyrin-like molybdotransferase Glp [Demequina maris]
MRSAAEHLAQVLALMPPPDLHVVRLADALGQVVAADVCARVALPPFDNSSMDGYAVRAADVARASASAPVALAVVGESAAGHPWTGEVAAGEAARIMTGAVLPAGADAVIPQEEVAATDGTVLVASPVHAGRFVRRRGEDAGAGDVVVAAGTVLAPRHLAAAASSGVERVMVTRPPRVAYLVTGDELVAPGGVLGPGQIFDSNAAYLAAALRALGAVPVDLGVVRDRPADVLAAVSGADADLVVTTGGASVGAHDPVKAGLAAAGVAFLNVAIQPGKPQGLGCVEGVPVVCLPGNPVAVAVCVEVFVGPAVRAMRGVPEPVWEPRRALEAWRCPPVREQVMPVVISAEGVRPATPGGSGSHLAASLAAADGLARVHAEADTVEVGDIVAVRRFTA